MEPEARYALVGTVAVLLVALLAGLLVWLRSSGELSNAHRFKIYFEHQSLQGVQSRADVTMRGVKVGSITGVRFSSQRPGAVEVTIAVDSHTPVRMSTQAVVERNILTGLATLQLVTIAENAPLLTDAPPGESDPIICEGESKMQQVTKSLDQLAAHADEAMQSVSATVSPENRAAIGEILDNLRHATRHLDATLSNADATMASLARASGEVKSLATALANDAHTLTARYDALGAEATTTVADARETVRKIGEDADRVARRADEVLASTGEEVHETAQDVRSAAEAVGTAAGRLRNPRHAIFGPPLDALGPGETEQ